MFGKKKDAYGNDDGGFFEIGKVILAIVLIAGMFIAAIKIGNVHTEKEIAWQEWGTAQRT